MLAFQVITCARSASDVEQATKDWQNKGWKVQVLSFAAYWMEDWSTKSSDSSRNDEIWLSLQGIQADLSTLQGRQKLIEGVIKTFGGSLHILGSRSSCQPVVMPGTSESFTSKFCG